MYSIGDNHRNNKSVVFESVEDPQNATDDKRLKIEIRHETELYYVCNVDSVFWKFWHGKTIKSKMKEDGIFVIPMIPKPINWNDWRVLIPKEVINEPMD